MSQKSIILYLHVHQPFRLRHYTTFDAGQFHNYFDSSADAPSNNESLIHKVAEKSYLPANQKLLELLDKHPEFKLNLSISGTALEQFEQWSPATLKSFQALTKTGRTEILGETYHHTLAFFHSQSEFETQVELHRQKIKSLFNQTPTAFRNTELAYNNDLGVWADKSGYKAILAEGWDPILGWRSPNFVYRPPYTEKVKILLRNYHLSDDITFRFGDRTWAGWPLTADKFAHWLSESGDATNFGLFMDYETFGEHQWSDSGIFDFLEHLPEEWLKTNDHRFLNVSEATEQIETKDILDMPETITWADTERDLSAWTGNPMQQQAIQAIYQLQNAVINSGDQQILNDWRKLQTSDHFYYMCTKWFNDGDIHAYFSPYDTPYEAFMNYMNAWHDLRFRLMELGQVL